ncbi:MAG TPA: DUF4190 domain-containing protein [Verrucomicrobiae bacterium]|nr:DUF4190 domain-containing protein [Verrucomicrobiae bacterium]
MNEIYKIIGDDGKEYGPTTAEKIRQWISEGRIERRTPVFVEGAKDWNFIGLLPEFANCFSTGTSPVPPAPIAAHGQLRKTNGFAIAGLILGIVSWPFCCCYGLPWSILGIVFSAIALSQIGHQPETYQGRGLAIAGLIVSILCILFYAIMLIIAAATGNFHVNSNLNFN